MPIVIATAAAAVSVMLGEPCPERAGSESSHPDSSIAHVQVAPDIHVFRAPEAVDQWTGTNALVVINETDVVVFDSGTRRSTACSVIARIRRLTSKPVRRVVNSHWHMDHWMGNSAYRDSYPGVDFIATTKTRDYMRHFTAGALVSGLERGIARERAALDSLAKGRGGRAASPAEEERRRGVAENERFAAEIRAAPRVLPDVTFGDSLVFWSGGREFRLFEGTGDATGSAMLYLPRERVLATGDVLVAPYDGMGHPPWTTNSFAISPWLATLRSLTMLPTEAIVPGQGPVFRDRAYLERTTALFDTVVSQVRAQLAAGVFVADSIVGRLAVDSLGRGYYQGGALPPSFRSWVRALATKAAQEGLDGVAR